MKGRQDPPFSSGVVLNQLNPLMKLSPSSLYLDANLHLTNVGLNSSLLISTAGMSGVQREVTDLDEM